MKTFTKAVLAAGLVGLVGTAEAALPYGYRSSAYGYAPNSYGGSQGIAVGGCYGTGASDRCGTGCNYDYGHDYGSTYHPTSYGHSAWDHSWSSRSAYNDDTFHTLPYHSGRGTSYGGWDDDCGYGTTGRLPSKSSSYHDRYNDRYDGSPMFEPWRPASASGHGSRWNW